MTILKRSRTGPSTPAAEPASARPPQPKRRIPIKTVDTADQAAKRAANAYTPPVDETSGTDFPAVIERYMGRIKNPMTAIRARCVQCCNGQVHEIQRCPCDTCALHLFRMGTNPLNKKVRDRMARQGGDDEGDAE